MYSHYALFFLTDSYKLTNINSPSWTDTEGGVKDDLFQPQVDVSTEIN